ncbi:MAG: hypothetical protein ABEI52_07835, partial [Halobacteriaceae archaeon]
ERNEDQTGSYKRDQVVLGGTNATLGRNFNRLIILAEHLANRKYNECHLKRLGNGPSGMWFNPSG